MAPCWCQIFHWVSLLFHRAEIDDFNKSAKKMACQLPVQADGETAVLHEHFLKKLNYAERQGETITNEANEANVE